MNFRHTVPEPGWPEAPAGSRRAHPAEPGTGAVL